MIASHMKEKKHVLYQRAKMLEKIRLFFSKKKILEVDCPSLTKYPSIDLHIDVMCVEEEKRYLHTSPEYAMKRLLSQYPYDIYQLGHVFRKKELGPFHSPEFTLIEWYRKKKSFKNFLKEVLELCHLFLGSLPHQILTYKELFQKHLKINPHKATTKELINLANKTKKISFTSKDKDILLDFLFSHYISPCLQGEIIYVITDYPASQAALAKTIKKQKDLVAERFEIFFQGMELGNGFHELIDEVEQRQRFIKINEKRKKMGKKKLPLDKTFLSSLPFIGDCYGIAMGFDRLLMLSLKKSSLSEIVPFSFDEI